MVKQLGKPLILILEHCFFILLLYLMLSEKHASDMLLSISWVCYYQQEAEAAYVYGNAIYDKIHLIKSLEDLYSHML